MQTEKFLLSASTQNFGYPSPWAQSVEKNIFTRWINNNMQKHPKAATFQPVQNLEKDLQDGLRLAALVEILTRRKVNACHSAPGDSRLKKLENVSKVLKYLQENEKLPIFHIGSIGIVDGDLAMTLELVWAIVQHYTIRKAHWGEDFQRFQEKLRGRTKTPYMDMTSRTRLLAWINRRLSDEQPILNFSNDWASIRALGALLNACAPGLCVDWADFRSEDALVNATRVVNLAETWLGVVPLVLPAEMVRCNELDERVMMTYLAQFPVAKLKPGAPIHDTNGVRLLSACTVTKLENRTFSWSDDRESTEMSQCISTPLEVIESQPPSQNNEEASTSFVVQSPDIHVTDEHNSDGTHPINADEEMLNNHELSQSQQTVTFVEITEHRESSSEVHSGKTVRYDGNHEMASHLSLDNTQITDSPQQSNLRMSVSETDLVHSELFRRGTARIIETHTLHQRVLIVDEQKKEDGDCLLQTSKIYQRNVNDNSLAKESNYDQRVVLVNEQQIEDTSHLHLSSKRYQRAVNDSSLAKESTYSMISFLPVANKEESRDPPVQNMITSRGSTSGSVLSVSVVEAPEHSMTSWIPPSGDQRGQLQVHLRELDANLPNSEENSKDKNTIVLHVKLHDQHVTGSPMTIECDKKQEIFLDDSVNHTEIERTIEVMPCITLPEQVEEDCRKIRSAIKSRSREVTSLLISILGMSSVKHRFDLMTKYKVMYGKDLHKEIKSHVSEKNVRRVLISMLYEKSLYDAICLHKVMCGHSSMREVVFTEIICTRTNLELAAVKAAYRAYYKRNLDSDIAKETTGPYRRLLLACLKCLREPSNALEVNEQQANHFAHELVHPCKKHTANRLNTFVDVFAYLSSSQLNAAVEKYADLTGRDIKTLIDEETSGCLSTALKTIVDVHKNKVRYFAAHLQKAFTERNYETVARVLITRTDLDMDEIGREFGMITGAPLELFIHTSLSGDYMKLLLTIYQRTEVF